MKSIIKQLNEFCICDGISYIESPLFEGMTDKDIDEWKMSGGKVVVRCKACGKEKITPQKAIAIVLAGRD